MSPVERGPAAAGIGTEANALRARPLDLSIRIGLTEGAP